MGAICQEQPDLTLTQLFIMFLKPFLNNVCSVSGRIILPKEATSTREHHCYEGVYLVSNNVYVYVACVKLTST